MNSNQFTSINTVVSRLYYDPLMSDCSKDFMVDKTIELMGVCGIPKTLQQKETVLDVENYRASVPCDFFEVRQVRVSKNGVVDPDYDALVATTNRFSPDVSRQSCLTYQIHGGILTASVQKCQLIMSYYAIATDEDGYPMVVNNQAFLRALESYIRLQWLIILFGQNKINQQVLAHAEQTYAWNISNATANLNTPTEDEAEALMHYINSPIKEPMHETAFADMSVQNKIKIH